MKNFKLKLITEPTFSKIEDRVSKFLKRTDVKVKDVKYTDYGDNVTAYIHYYPLKK